MDNNSASYSSLALMLHEAWLALMQDVIHSCAQAAMKFLHKSSEPVAGLDISGMHAECFWYSAAGVHHRLRGQLLKFFTCQHTTAHNGEPGDLCSSPGSQMLDPQTSRNRMVAQANVCACS